jgi:hypothetical protein
VYTAYFYDTLILIFALFWVEEEEVSLKILIMQRNLDLLWWQKFRHITEIKKE